MQKRLVKHLWIILCLFSMHSAALAEAMNPCVWAKNVFSAVDTGLVSFEITGGGAFCLGGAGVPLGLNGSQNGILYFLHLNDTTAVGEPLTGAGASLSFGLQTAAGVYSIIAVDTIAHDTLAMTGTVDVSTFNCQANITDPCSCKNNATTLSDGQFDETVTVNAPAGQTWSLVSSSGFYLPTSPAPPAAPLPIPAGTLMTYLGGNVYELKGIHVDALGYSVMVANGLGTTLTIGNSCRYPNPVLNPALVGNFCQFSTPITLSGNPGDANSISQTFTINGVPATVFDPAALGVGNYTIEYTVDGGAPKAFGPIDPGCVQKVSTTVHVVATPSTLTCNDLIFVSIDATCTGVVTPDDILEGTYGCYDDYLVELDKTLPFGNGPWESPNLTAADIGKTYRARVTHQVSGTKCFGSIVVEDKIAPTIVCQDIHLACPITNYAPGYLKNTLGIAEAIPTISDCSSFISSSLDTWFDLSCGGTVNGVSDISGYIRRKWTAIDQYGNSSTCFQYLYLDRLHVDDVKLPGDFTVPCGPNESVDPAVTGAPYFEAFGMQWPINPGVGSCELQTGYVDVVLPVCEGTRKIVRTWTIIDWCLPTSIDPPLINPVYHIQVITVLDEHGPVMTCPSNTTVSVNPFACCANVDMPDLVISDNCSRINNISGTVETFDPYTGAPTGTQVFGGVLTDFPGNNWWNRDTMARWGQTSCLPVGTHTVTYQAKDDCNNSATCSFRLTIADWIPPVASCDQTTTVSLGLDDLQDCYTPTDGCDGAGVTWLSASTVDDGSSDGCNNIKRTIRRMKPYSACIEGLSHAPCYPGGLSEYKLATAELDSVKFYCCEAGTTQTVILRVYQVDVNGNVMNGSDGTPLFNECMVQVEVQDKIKPTCAAPANVTVSCEQFDPSLLLYGNAFVFDNCCLDESKTYLGQCGLTHTANYSQFDTVCNKGTIVRTFRAFDCHGQSSQCTQRIVVNYEQDYYVKFPNDVIITACDGTGAYGEPTFYGEDCELLGVSYEDEIFNIVTDACYKIDRTWKIINWCTYNPNLSPLCIDVPNPTPNAISNHATNLPGPIVSPIQTVGDPWKSTIVKITPTDPAPTNYSTFYNPNANCYTYKQTIKIIDNQAPQIECPASPSTICDLTANDVELWNAAYWWDNANQSHNLCEAPADLCITATDACSGANISIRYQLFLDLDGDGTMETVVNSTQLGSQPGGLGWNNILFGNVSGAGTPRQFDQRSVPANQKWGFAMQETIVGNKRIACVKFNTFQAQSSYQTAQLPHGTHKIKWFVADGCGNETVCECTIIIKDCKPPTVVCHAGLSVDIMPSGTVTLWASDFLQYGDDNCTLPPLIEYAIRPCGQGNGFPIDPFGQPSTSVVFDCNNLATQCVELWAIDLAGNASYCETSVVVQDNFGNCDIGGTVNVSGSLKTPLAGGEEGIEEAIVGLAVTDPLSGATTNSSYLTDGTGDYGFYHLPVNGDIVVTPTKNDNPLNGVTTYDLVLMSKHILGITPLSTPYEMIAADANKSNSITTFDIVIIRKLILGIFQDFPSNTSWRFVPKDYVFQNPANPFETAFPEKLTFANITAPLPSQHFIGIKIGDVNNTVIPNSFLTSDDRNQETVFFDLDDREVQAGEVFDVPFRASEKTEGYQMTLNLQGLEVAELIGSENVDASNFGVFNDAGNGEALTVSILNAGMFTVKFRALQTGKLSEMLKLSSQITRAEAYKSGDVATRMDVGLRFHHAGDTYINGVGFELYQNEPNPFTQKTNIQFHLPEAAFATLRVFDETGELLFQEHGDFPKGYNTIVVDAANVNKAGVMYYTLETASYVATHKMVCFPAK